MGRLKESLGAGVGRGRWRRFTPTHRCVVCGRPKTCSVTDDGAVVWCAKVASDEPHTSGIAEGWLHRLDNTGRAQVRALPLPAAGLAQRPGPRALRDRVYRALLDTLALSRPHREGLRARGLDDARIARGGYATLPPWSERGFAERRLEGAFTDGELAQVPGLVRGGRAWQVVGAPGLLVPVRDVLGRVVALKVRMDQAQAEGGRYRYLTSSSRGGPKASLAVHAPADSSPRGAARLFVTEGELKADVASALLGAPVVGIPGVSSWTMGRDAVLWLRPREVVVAMDMDRETNPAVRAAQAGLVRSLRAEGLRVADASWDPAHKGLDDALRADRGAVAA